MEKLNYIKFLGFLLLFCGFFYGNAVSQTITISIPNEIVDAGDEVTIPISVSEITEDDNIFSGEWKFTTSSDLITFQSISTAGTLLDGINSSFNSTSGNFAFASTQPVTGSGTILNLTVQVRENAVKFEEAVINITDARFNEGEPQLESESGTVSVRGIELTPKKPSSALIEGQTFQFSVEGNVTEPVNWSSSDTEIATVTSEGLVEGITPGTVKIFVEDAAGLADSTDFFRVEPASLQELTLGVSDRTVTQTLTDSVQVMVSDLTGLNITSGQFDLSFTSSKLEILSISTAGTILEGRQAPTVFEDGSQMSVAFADAVPYEGEGALFNIVFSVNRDATGTASFIPQNVLFNEDYEADTYSGTVTIEGAPEIVVNQPEDELTIGEGQTYTVDSGGTAPYVWRSDDESVAVIDENTGELEALARGTTNIIATDSDGFESDPVQLTVNDVTVEIPDVNVGDYEIFSLPITTTDLTGLGIIAYEVDLDFDESLLNFEAIEQNGTISEELSLSSYEEQGVLKIAVAGTVPLEGEGELLRINFSVQNTVDFGTSGIVNPSRVQFNEPGPDTPTATRRSGTVNFVDSVLPAQVTLVSPENLESSVPTTPEFTWEEITDAVEYELEIYSDAELTQPVASQQSISDTSYLLEQELDLKTDYYWRARAVNTEGAGPWSETWTFETVPGIAAAPDLIEPSDQQIDVSVNTILSWASSIYSESYEVELSTDPLFETVDLVESVTDTQLQVENLEFETVYFWRVRGVNELGEGDFSDSFSFTTEVDDSTPSDAVFTYSDLNVLSAEIISGNTITVRAVVENIGESTGEYSTPLYVNGEVVSRKSGVLDENSQEVLIFNYQINEPGDYEVTIADLPVENVTVQPGWTQYNFGSDNNSAAEFLSGPQTDQVRENWLVDISAWMRSSPVVADGVVYFGSNDNSVYAISESTGEVIWEFETQNSVRSSPALVDNKLIIGNDDGILFGIDIDSGDELWRFTTQGAIRSSPTVINGIAYFGVFDEENGQVYAIDIDSGSSLFSFPTGASIFSSPAVSEEILYVGSNDNSLYALDISSDDLSVEDRVIWSYEGAGSFVSTPVVYGDFVYASTAAFGDVEFYAFDKHTGEVRWSRTVAGNRATSPAVVDDVLYVGSGEAELFALNYETGQEIWSTNIEPDFGSISFSTVSPTIANGYLYIGTTGNNGSARMLVAVDITDGSELFRYDGIGNVHSSPTVINGNVYIGSDNTGLHSFREITAEDLMPDPVLSEVSATTPHWADGSDQSRVDLVIVNGDGDPITGLTTDDFQFNSGNAVLAGSVEEQFTDGNYRLYLQNSVAETVRLTVRVSGVELSDQPEIEFLTAESDWTAVAFDQISEFSDITSIQFINESTGWLAGNLFGDGVFENEYTIFKTTDGGETWTNQYRSEDQPVNEIFFVNERLGWAAGPSNGVLYTEDGGESWIERQVDESGNFQFFNTVYFLDESTGWIGGSDLYKTTDGGESWASQNVPEDINIRDIKFLDDQTGYVAMTNSQLRDPGLLVTNDGGNSWTPDLEGARLTAIDVSQSGAIFLVGWDGIIFKSNPDGSTWELVDSGVAVNLNSIEFIGERTGRIVGNSSTILATNDAGDTWQKEYPGTTSTNELYDLSFSNEEFGWAVGRQRTLLRYGETTSAPPMVDADQSSVETTTPHLADGVDQSFVSVTLLDSDGNPIDRYAPSELNIQITGDAAFTQPDNLGDPGQFGFTVTNSTAETVTVTVTVDDIQLSDQPEIVFEEPIQLVDSEQSVVTATSPHLADGEDQSFVSVALVDSLGEPVDRINTQDISVAVSGSAQLSELESTGDPGEFALTVTNAVAETVLITVTVEGVVIGDQPEIIFEEIEIGIPLSPILTSVTAVDGSAEINWSVTSSEHVDRFFIYRGDSVGNLTVINETNSGVRSFTDQNPPEGTSVYAISAVNRNEEESDISNTLYFVKSEVVASTEWQLISIPLQQGTADMELATIYSFSDRYDLNTSFEPGKGYWVKTRTFDDEKLPASGTGLDSLRIELNAGWNLIGSLSLPVSLSDVRDPEEILTEAPVYLYKGENYQTTRELVPNFGHWVFARDSGHVKVTIQNQPPTAGIELADSQVQNFESDGFESDLARIKFQSGDFSTELIASQIYLSESEQLKYLLPPRSPDPKLDVRVNNRSRLINNEPSTLQITADEYPIRISLEGLDESSGYAYRLHAEKQGESRTIDIKPGSSEMLDQEYDRIEIEMIYADEVVTENELLPNYPNPFNPTTTIQYQLREQTHVMIEVYDVIGRRIQLLANETQLSGQHRVDFDGSNLSSGLYFIRFQAGDVVDIRKMTLIK